MRGKKCPRCNTINDLSASFCIWCGANISDIARSEYPEEETTIKNADTSFASTAPSYVSRYKTAIFVSQVVAFFGWVLVIIGLLFAVVELFSNSSRGVSLIAMLPGLGAAVSGLFLVMGGQITRATVDNADHTRELLNRLTDK